MQYLNEYYKSHTYESVTLKEKRLNFLKTLIMRTPVIRRVSGTDCAHNSGFYCTSKQGRAANLGLAARLNEEDQEFYRPADGGP